MTETPTDYELEMIRDGYAAMGRIHARYLAAKTIADQALTDAAHGELKAAGLCDCDAEPDKPAEPPTTQQVADRIRAMFTDLQPHEQAIRAETQQMLDGLMAKIRARQTDETARSFVACKAPNPLRPGWFCGRPIGHSHEGGGCIYEPMEQPASADDEGDETAAKQDPDFDAVMGKPWPGEDSKPARAQGGIIRPAETVQAPAEKPARVMPIVTGI